MSDSRKQLGSARTVFLIAVTLSAAALLGISFLRGESMIEMMARGLTQYVVPINATIMFGFAVIVSLVGGVFFHYYVFELRDRYVYEPASARKMARAVMETERPAEERLASVRKMLDKDDTLFGQVFRRFLNENGFGAPRPGKVWQAIQDEEFDRVKRNLMYFSLASVISPAIGFLGTAVGMVSAFYEISIQDTVTPADLALSIQVALITTVIGLVIKTISMLLKTAVVHSIGRREDQLAEAYHTLFER
jgi:biopolymer transport protein ExbB/TolQ